MDHAIVFIHLGPTIPAYTHVALSQARLFNQCPIYLVAEQPALDAFRPNEELTVSQVPCESLGLSETHREFRSLSTLDKTFRNGFWTFTTERFFYLESLMQQRGLSHVFHLENDYMVYVDLATIHPVFATQFPNLAGTFDNDQRCIPGFVYVSHAAALGRLTRFINQLFRSTSQPLNDMILLGAFGHQAGTQYLAPLPVLTTDYPHPLRSRVGHTTTDPQRYSNLVREMGGIFDGGALGQYLGGIDPRNAEGRDSVGFINESCVFDPSVYSYFWNADAMGRRVPSLSLPQGTSCRINSLHIHSKRLLDFASHANAISAPARDSFPA